MILAAIAVAIGDVTPRFGNFNPKRLVEERSFAAPGLWLLSAGGKYIASNKDGDSFNLIETSTGKDLGSFGGHGGAGRHDWNWGQSDRILATTAGDGAVKVWDATTRKEIASFTGDQQPHSGYT